MQIKTFQVEGFNRLKTLKSGIEGLRQGIQTARGLLNPESHSIEFSGQPGTQLHSSKFEASRDSVSSDVARNSDIKSPESIELDQQNSGKRFLKGAWVLIGLPQKIVVYVWWELCKYESLHIYSLARVANFQWHTQSAERQD